MSVVERLLTYENIGELPAEGSYEVLEGRLIEMAPSGGEHGFYEQKVARRIDEKLEKEGYVLVGEVGMVIRKDPLTLRAADVVFISKERMSKVPKGFLEVPPDLV
ncbi:Uma2 family endonuclease, partial [Hydrogenivirga sp.]